MIFTNAKMQLIFSHSIVRLPMLSSSMQECPPLEGQQDYHWLTGRLHKAQFPISLFIDNKVCGVTGGGLRTWAAHLLAISLLYTGSARIQQPTQQWETWSHFNNLHQVPGLYWLSGKTSYRKILWSLEAMRFELRRFQSLWNSTDTLAAVCLSNFRAIRSLKPPISPLRDFTRSCSKMSVLLVNRCPVAGSTSIRALPVPEIEALSLTKLHTSGGRRNM